MVFLDALADRKKASRLRELLDVAEAAMRELVLVRGAAAPQRTDETDHGNKGTQNAGG